jgi:hypothetical protein
MSRRRRLLLVPEFTELEWAIKPQDAPSFVRYGIAQVTQGGIDEERGASAKKSGRGDPSYPPWVCQYGAMESATAPQPAGGADLNRLAASATTHCLTGCAIGEVAGMALATAFGWGNFTQITLAVVLAYFFGFALTAMPLIRAGLAAGVIVSTALAADTVSITIMEAIDNVTVVLIPNAVDAGLTDALFYGSIAAGFAIAYPFAFWANRYMIARGKGHAMVHEHH